MESDNGKWLKVEIKGGEGGYTVQTSESGSRKVHLRDFSECPKLH